MGNTEGCSSLSRKVFDRKVVSVAAASKPFSPRRGIVMSDPSSTGTESTGPAKKKVSPARNAVGLVVLLALIVVIGFQYPAFFRFNAAVKALDTRMSDEDQGVLKVQEAEGLLGKPDGPGSDLENDGLRLTAKTYTWHGPLKSFTVKAFYTRGSEPYLHHFETDGAKFVPEPVAVDPGGNVPTAPSTAGKGRGKRKAPAPEAGPSKGAVTTDRVPGKAIAPTPAAEPPKATTGTGPTPAKPAAPFVEPSKEGATPASAPAKANGPAPAAEPRKDAAKPAPSGEPK